jgi:hypothetical protein
MYTFRTVRRDAASDLVDRPGLHRVPRSVVHRDVIGVGDLVHVDERPRGVEAAGRVGGQRVDRAVDLVRGVGNRGRGRAGVHVARDELVRRRQARPVGEVAADVQLAPDDLQRGHVGRDRGTERLPAHAIPDGEEVGVGVAPRVDEVPADVDLAGSAVDGDGMHGRACGRRDHRRSDRMPGLPVPAGDHRRRGVPTGTGEDAAGIDRVGNRAEVGRADEGVDATVERGRAQRGAGAEMVPAAGAGRRRGRA